MGYGEGTAWQDALAIVWVVLLAATIGRATTGDRHLFGHAMLIPISILLPSVAIDWSGGVNSIPDELWGLFGAFVAVEIIHFSVHYFFPDLGHNAGPEVFNQVALSIWAARVAGVVSSTAPHLWYRAGAQGDTTQYSIGSLIFAVGFIVINFSVLYFTYANGSELPRDEIDLLKYTFRSPGNYYFLVGSITSTMVAFYVAWGDAWIIGVSFGVFHLLQLVRPRDDNEPRSRLRA